MQNRCFTKDNLIIVELYGDLDHHVTEAIRKDIDDLFEKNRMYSIVFDFENVGFMDSSGIGLIMGRYRKVSLMGGYIYVSNLGFAIQRIFKLSGLNSITIQSRDIDNMVKEATYEQNKNGI